jgi:hypothetical protein
VVNALKERSKPGSTKSIGDTKSLKRLVKKQATFLGNESFG